MENQISPIAGRMKTVQGMLAQYFIMKSPANSENSPSIEFISSANKLKDFTTQIPKSTPKSALNEDGIVEPKATDREKYKKHKTDSIFICSQFLKTNDNLSSWSNVLLTPKKDDLADCFLQGIWYLKREKIITYAENLKINSMYLS